ncbi:hypothetical protein AB4254_11020 [Vibrio breoganii]
MIKLDDLLNTIPQAPTQIYIKRPDGTLSKTHLKHLDLTLNGIATDINNLEDPDSCGASTQSDISGIKAHPEYTKHNLGEKYLYVWLHEGERCQIDDMTLSTEHNGIVITPEY